MMSMKRIKAPAASKSTLAQNANGAASASDGAIAAFDGPWDTLNPQLSPPILHAIGRLGFTQMTPVQAATVPLFMRNKDVIVEAVTGSGKTLSFVIPVLEIILRRSTPLKKNEVGAIIISPTRELAKQIYEVTSTILESINSPEFRATLARRGDGGDDDDDEKTNESSKKLEPAPLTHKLFIGGSSVQEDVQAFKKDGGNIIIATPGRLDDLLKRSGVFSVKELGVLVLDEADRLLDMGFETTLTSIITKLPKQRRTGLFSATMTEALDSLVRAGLRNPVKIIIKVESDKQKSRKGVATSAGGEGDEGSDDKATTSRQMTPSTLTVQYVIAEQDEKLAQLVHHLRRNPHSKTIVYFATCASVDYFFKIFSSTAIGKDKRAANSKTASGTEDQVSFPAFKNYIPGVAVHSLHGKMDPKRREAVYEKFTTNIAPAVLLTTDVSSRGLDIPDVDWVIQFDPPQDPKTFSHRCGRTARAGRVGSAVVYLGGAEETYAEFLRIRKIPMASLDKVPDDEPPSGANSAASSKPGDLATSKKNKQPPSQQKQKQQQHPIHTSGLTAHLRHLSKSDKDTHDKSLKAFVSWIRYYNEHHAKAIFRFDDVDLARVAMSFGVLRLPRCPELRNKKVVGFEEVIVDIDKIPYQNAQREKQRQEKLTLAAKSGGGVIKNSKKRPGPSVTPSWSKQKEAKERREVRREKKVKRKEATLRSASASDVATVGVGVKRKLEVAESAVAPVQKKAK